MGNYLQKYLVISKARKGNSMNTFGWILIMEKNGEVQVLMRQYVKKIIKNFLEDICLSTAATPAMDHLFQIQDANKAKLLPEEQAIQFHCTVAQLLLVCMRARHDIQTTIVFLSTRVKAPDEDDWPKLKRVIK